MDLYEVRIASPAVREIKKLSADVQARVVTVLHSLSMRPRPMGVQKLTLGEGYYRIRVGDYRIVYRIEDASRIVTVEYVRHRRDAYRD